MHYIQNDYPGAAYPGPGDPAGTIASSGCGLCCCSIVVEMLTGDSFPPTETAALAFACGARDETGTEISVLAPAVCKKFDLFYALTNDCGRVLQFLQEGRGMAVANVGGDREGYAGVFSEDGHFIVLAAARGREITVLDPWREEGRFDRPGRRDKVRVEGTTFFTDVAVIARECDNRTPAYTLIWK